jgi:pimeloyl-ACP methyl ester carboxylesterase
MAQLDVNGLQIEYDTFGQAGADPILLIMGLGTQMIAWSPDFCNALAEHGHYVIRFDNRDIGLSTKFDRARPPSRLRYMLNHLLRVPLGEPYSLEDMASDTAGVLDALDLDSAHIVGASMGGMIAQLLAVNHPQRVKSLTSIMSTSGARHLPRARPEVVQHVFVDRPKTTDTNVLIEYLMTSLRLVGSPGYPQSDEELREQFSASLDRSYYPQGFKRQFAAIVGDRSRVERLRRLDKPTLVIHGSEDPLVPVEHGIDTARHIAGAKLEIIEGMGHDLPPQLIDKLTTLIAAHAREHAGTPQQY